MLIDNDQQNSEEEDEEAKIRIIDFKFFTGDIPFYITSTLSRNLNHQHEQRLTLKRVFQSTLPSLYKTFLCLKLKLERALVLPRLTDIINLVFHKRRHDSLCIFWGITFISKEWIN